MRRILAGSVSLALSLGTLRGYAEEIAWPPVSGTPRIQTVTLGPPTVGLGAPRAGVPASGAVQPASLTWTTPSRTVRAKIDDKAQMPTGPVLPTQGTGGTTALPPPTPLGMPTPAPGGPMVQGPFLTNPELNGQVVSSPVWPGSAGAPCGSCDPNLAPLPGGVFVPESHPCGYLLYGSAEYLMWWIRGAQVPALLITGTPQTGSTIGNPTTLVGGNTMDDQQRWGGRFTLGGWFTRCQNWGMDGSYFFLGKSTNTAAFSVPGTGVLARPFTNPDGTPNSELIAFPGISAGSFVTTTSNEFWGADINLKKNLWLGCWWRVDALAGVRYLRFNEDISINENFMGVPNGPFAGVNGMIQDNFAVKNEFYGGQLGLNSEWRRGRWSVNMLTKVALGTTRQTIDIAGTQTITATAGANAIPGTYPGLLAQPSNIGHHTRDTFGVVPELGLNVGWQATNHLKLFVGYNFLYWSNVIRAGDQIDTVVDVVPSRLNGSPVPPLVQPPGATRPMVPFKETDFWAQGISLGLQFTW